MRRSSVTVGGAGLSAILLTWLLLAAPGAGANELWLRAVELYAAHGNLVPGRMQISFSQYGARDRLLSSEETEIVLAVGADGEVQGTVIRATRDGRDVTRERQENPSSGNPFGGGGGGAEADGPFSGLQKSPFDPAEQESVRLVRIGAPELIETAAPGEPSTGRLAVVPIEFEHATGPRSANRGTAWISVADGTPVRLELTVTPLPTFVDRLHIRQEYMIDSLGRWVTRTLFFEGEGRLLFLRRRVESVLEFSEYFRSP